MKLAILSRAAHPLHGPGGLERAVYLQAKHLTRAGASVHLFTRPAERPPGEAFPGEVVSVPYGSLPGLRHGRVLDRIVHYRGFSRRLGAACARAVRDGEIDLVHAEGAAGWGYALEREAHAELRAPLVLNPQGMEEHRTRGWKRLALTPLRRLSVAAARRADRVIATDEATRDDVPRLLGVAPERVSVLPNGVDLEEIDALTPASPRDAVREALPSLVEGSPLVLSVGRLERYKGFEDTREALERLRATGTLGDAWAWIVVGRGPLMASLATGPLAPHVHVLERVEDPLLHALYAVADVFVHATRFEGSSLVTLEAMAHRCAIVATRAGGIPDKIDDGRTGRLVEPGRPDALAAAIAASLGDPASSRSMGQLARGHVEARFDWRALAPRALALYESLLAETA